MTEGKSLCLSGFLGPMYRSRGSFILLAVLSANVAVVAPPGVLGGFCSIRWKEKHASQPRREQPSHLLPQLCCPLGHDVLGLFKETVRLGGAGKKTLCWERVLERGGAVTREVPEYWQ